MKLKIADNIKEAHPETKLACIVCDIDFQKENPSLKKLMLDKVAEIENNIQIEQIAKFKEIADSRKAYKAFGKDPSRYRLSAEALHRRILKKQGLYFINNIVDITNQISLEKRFSLGTYDFNEIQGDVVFEIAEEKANYEGINRGVLNIEFLPAFKDSVGYFGNPTGDSARTLITEKANKILMVIISFSGDYELESASNYAVDLLKEFANAKNIETQIIG